MSKQMKTSAKKRSDVDQTAHSTGFYTNESTENTFEDILQNPSYGSTYSLIHGNQLASQLASRDSYDGSYSTNSQRNSNSPKSPMRNQYIAKSASDVRRSDVVSVQYLSTSSPSSSKVKGKSSRLSEPGPNTRIPAGSTYGSTFVSTYGSTSEAFEYVPGDPDQMSDWFGTCKRFQGVKRAVRAAPYHVDPIGGPSKTRSTSVPPRGNVVMGRPKVLRDSILDLLEDEMSVQSYPHFSASGRDGRDNRDSQNSPKNSPKNGMKSSMKNDDDSSSSRARLSINIPSNNNNNSYTNNDANNGNNSINNRYINDNEDDSRTIKDDSSNTKNLYGTIMELADDDSYQAHYDRINELPIEIKSSAHSPLRAYKLAPRNTNSQLMQSLLRCSDDYSVESGSRVRGNMGGNNYNNGGNNSNNGSEKENQVQQKDEKDRVKAVETNILNHLQGRVGGLRHHLNKMDPSHSGVVNFSEFSAALKQLGVDASNPQLKEIFHSACEDRKGRGNVNNYETWGQDVRYSKGAALNIDKFTENLTGLAIQSESEKGGKEEKGERGEKGQNDKNGRNGKNDTYTAEQSRAIKKVLHATNKREDPMRVFSHLTQGNGNNEGKGTTVGFLAPQQLKEGLNTLGSNLTDKEFGYLLDKVGTSYDGKISLQEFDEVLHNEVGGYESEYNTVKRDQLTSNPRYSKTYQSHTTLQQHTQPEYDKVTDSRIARGDRMKWGKLQGVLQENCQNLPEAFMKAAMQMSERGRSNTRGDTRGEYGGKRSHSVGSTRTYARFSDGGENDIEVTSSGRYYGREREEREENNLAINDLPLLPIKSLRDVLSDAGVQLGTDDAERLSTLITREVSQNNNNTGTLQDGGMGGGRGSGVTDEPSVSFSRFCEIVGITGILNPSTSQKEVYDPRTIATDGGVFARSITASSHTPRVSGSNSGISDQPQSTQSNQYIQSKSAQLQTHMADNRLKNFGSTFLSDTAPRKATPTSLEGSRRRCVNQQQYLHTSNPSRFWELEQTGRVRDTLPSPMPSIREPWPAAVSGTSFIGSPGRLEMSSRTSMDYPNATRFKTTSPIRPQSPSMSSMMTGERGDRSERGGESGGRWDRGDRNNYSTPISSNRKRSSSAPPRSSSGGNGGGNSSSKGLEAVSGFEKTFENNSNNNNSNYNSENGDNGGNGVNINLRWASKSLANFVTSKSSVPSAAVRSSMDSIRSPITHITGITGATGSTGTTSTTHDTYSANYSAQGAQGKRTSIPASSAAAVSTTPTHRTYSLRKVVPGQNTFSQVFGGTSSVGSGVDSARGGQTVSRAPYAVSLPDQ